MSYLMKVAVMACAMAFAGAALAQPAPGSVRLRGEIVSVKGDALVLRPRNGDAVSVALAPDLVVGAVKNVRLSDIKPGSFIGTAARTGADGKMTAIEVHVFDESARGSGEGHRGFDLGPDSTMTNANVESVVHAADGRVLELSYKGGKKTVTVPENAPVVAFIAASRTDLVPGKKAIVTAIPAGADGLATKRVLVEKDGVVPPM